MNNHISQLGSGIGPLFARSVFTDPGYFVWCGSPIRDDAGRYHLLYSRWRLELGFDAWVTHSEVAHAVADDPLGPYRFDGVALPERGEAYWDGHCTHNPTVHFFDGLFYLYYMGNRGDRKAVAGLNWSHRNNQRIGVAIAESPAGPWRRFDSPLISPTPGFRDALCCSNPTIVRRTQGDFILIYKAVDQQRPLPFGGPVTHVIATSALPDRGFCKLPTRVFDAPGDFPAEDPCIWQGDDGYRCIIKDMNGEITGAGMSLALFHSSDAVTWSPATIPLLSGRAYVDDRHRTHTLARLERPQVLLHNGEDPIVYLAAATNGPGGQIERTFGLLTRLHLESRKSR